ncbi:MAG: 4Fe-4S dicluster domain-containing protein [Myxococcota bacterium]
MWRSLDDKARSAEELNRLAEEEQPGGFMGDLVEPSTLVSRRAILKGSSIAALAAGLQGCLRRPEDIIFPYSKAPENLIPGIPSHFATVTARGRDALGVVATSHDGRPTKIEGNTAFPTSLGATDVRGQLYVWDLYDPDRSKSPAKREGGALKDATSDEFDEAFEGLAKKHAADQGAGLRLLAPISNSPSFRAMRDKVQAKFPKSKFHTYSPVNDDNAREGARMALQGKATPPLYDHSKSLVTLSFGSDFLGKESGSVAAARRFAMTRAIAEPDQPMNRLYVIESNFTVTGSMADHRLRSPQSDIEWYAKMLVIGLAGRGVDNLGALAKVLQADLDPSELQGLELEWLLGAAADLLANKGRCIVLAGASQPPRVHALVNAINGALGNFGRTTFFGPEVDADEAASVESIASLASDSEGMSTLVIIGGNPVYDAPADVDFARLLAREGLTSVHLSDHRNETTLACSWHAPLAHELEAWGDQQSQDGAVAVQQPLIAPLYGGRSAIEFLAAFADEETTRGHDIVKATHADQVKKDTKALLGLGAPDKDTSPESVWRRSLHAGILFVPKGTKPPVALQGIIEAFAEKKPRTLVSATNLEVSFEPDNGLWDGQHANNLWALELPSPMTKIVWDNAAIMSPATRDALELENGQMVRLKVGDRQVEVPVWPLPGHADNCITLTLGWGRTAAGRYGNGKGFDVNPLRTSDGMGFANGVKAEALPESYNLVQTQTHDRMEGRPIAIDATLEEYKEEPDFASYRSVEPVSTPPLWKQQDYSEGYQWGMTIDLASCSGCNACVVACQAENTIPSVGKIEVERGREMHWLRIDRYFVGDDQDSPQVAVQPVGCQQCEEAPCENVCPVNATVHSPEGLNDMVYNRCVGTRYCANNCPYKVRRFNYLDWQGHLDDKWAFYGDFPESRKLQFNPNVTVRMRGVMEKCTYCVQRIQEAKIAANREDRTIRDGEVTTACQQACPSGAITFGNLNDPNARVTKLKAINRQYQLLAEIGTRPRTTFLARVRNPNPKLEGKGS